MALPKFYEVLERDAEFVYGATAWVPELVDIRAGGLIPIARQYPGAREFVESFTIRCCGNPEGHGYPHSW